MSDQNVSPHEATINALRIVAAAYADVEKDDIRVTGIDDTSFTMECFRDGGWQVMMRDLSLSAMSYMLGRHMISAIERASEASRRSRALAKADAERETKLRNVMEYMDYVVPNNGGES